MLKDIDPSKFEYEAYKSNYGAPISEQYAREKMTDYHYVNCDPLLIRTVDERYYLPGPDEETNQIKWKFYHSIQWYHDLYDGRHGQRTETHIDTVDLSHPDLQNLVVSMAVSGDFTLQEALYAVAHACDRCRMVLMHKYAPELGGYSDVSDEYYKSNARCNFCRYDDYRKEKKKEEMKQHSKQVSELCQMLTYSINDIQQNMMLDGIVQSPIGSLRMNVVEDQTQTMVLGPNGYVPLLDVTSSEK